ncbi:unnamed protein product [Soboliphyme baturini]|uniref:BLOC-1-related complex subunit 7 n=1 Tax=Soboliphyme baturini TaxID=241478 RepID=A0A183IWI2_9BILA|nr:unnamed protein product [Soboliphyme baturini]
MRVNTSKMEESLVLSRSPARCSLQISIEAVKQMEKFNLSVVSAENGIKNDRRIGISSGVLRVCSRLQSSAKAQTLAEDRMTAASEAVSVSEKFQRYLSELCENFGSAFPVLSCQLKNCGLEEKLNESLALIDELQTLVELAGVEANVTAAV